MHYVKRKGLRGPSVSYNYYHPREIERPKKSRKAGVVFAVFLFVVISGSVFYIDSQAKNLLVYQPNLANQVQASQAVTEQAPISTPQESPPQELADPAVINAKLQTILDEWATSHKSKQWSVVIEGLGQETFSAKLNPDKVYGAASMFKLLLVYPLFQKNSVSELPGIKVSAAGKTQKLSDCVDLMLRVSNNPCGEVVGKYIGWKTSDLKLKELGLVNTKLNSKSEPRTSAADTALLLRHLYSGPGISPEAKQYILGILKGQTWRKGIPTGCSGCTVFNKTGDIGSLRHDAAIIEHSKGVYLLSIYTNGASYAQIAELTELIHESVTDNN